MWEKKNIFHTEQKYKHKSISSKKIWRIWKNVYSFLYQLNMKKYALWICLLLLTSCSQITGIFSGSKTPEVTLTGSTGSVTQTGSTWALVKTIEESIQELTKTGTLSNTGTTQKALTGTLEIPNTQSGTTLAQTGTVQVEQKTATWTVVTPSETVANFPGKWKLQALVFYTVEQKTKGFWDKKIEISKVHTSSNAAIWSWGTEETHWSWIAWKDENAAWKVLLDNDGYNCKELENIPQELKDFFKAEITINGKDFCFN